MKFLSMLVLVLSCFFSYGETEEKNVQIDKQTQEARQELILEARETLAIAVETFRRTEKDFKQESEVLAEVAKTLAGILSKYDGLLYSSKQIHEATLKVREANENLEKLEQEKFTEATGSNRCATCDDEVASLHTVQVERDENTNPEVVAKESSGKKGARGGDSGSR